jgi:hypothetical protein
MLRCVAAMKPGHTSPSTPTKHPEPAALSDSIALVEHSTRGSPGRCRGMGWRARPGRGPTPR